MLIAALFAIDLDAALRPAVTCAEVQAKAREIAHVYANGWRIGPVDNGGWTDALRYYVSATKATPDEAQRWAKAACALRGISVPSRYRLT